MITDFLGAAFPWIAIGLGVAIVLTYQNKKKDQDAK